MEQTKIYQITETAPVIRDGKALLVEPLHARRNATIAANACMASVFAKKDGRERVAIKWIAKICVQVMVFV